MKMYQLIVKFMAIMAVKEMFECNEFKFTEANAIIFQMQDSSHTGTCCRIHLSF